jgi:hypothetical protein
MAIARGTCFRDDARRTPAVVACFAAKENQIARIVRIPIPFLKASR